jgi:pyruvate dehydrogenase E2 component (dihydrolipoamide acetyltransferase)/2-oxoisovalerate dehydrogenase E2 component (dihydrolipoyl transacylase)
MDFRLPELGEGVYEAELVSWLVKPGDAVQRGQNLMEVLTDKATMEVPSPFAGTVTELRAEPGQRIMVGDLVLSYTAAGQSPTGDGKTASAEKPVKELAAAVAASSAKIAQTAAAMRAATGRKDAAAAGQRTIRAAPSVRLLARKLGVDLGKVRGSGPGGRVLVEDLNRVLAPAQATPKPAVAKPSPDYGKPGTQIKVQGLRRLIAENMVRANQTIPHYGYVDECDATDLVRLRESLKELSAARGIKLTYLAFAVKAVTVALKEVPLVNASLNDRAEEILLHDHYHIGVAVAAPHGLIVPVVRDVDRKDVFQIAQDIERLSNEARAGKSRRDDLLGATFTITSVGNIGGLFFTPVINPPQVGILGLGKIVKRPVFDHAGQVRAADMLYLSFSFDHRVVDGAVGAAFGNVIIEQLRNPARLLVPENR